MKEDLKNVIISFGLIAVVLTNGSFAYQLAIKDEELRGAKAAAAIALAEQNSLIEKARQEELKKQQVAQKSAAQQAAAQQSAVQQAADLARQQAQVLAQAKAKALAEQQARAAAQASVPVVVAPSRRSRAS